MNSLKKAYGEYFDFALLHSELSIVYSSAEFHKTCIHELWVYFEFTDLSDSLSQITESYLRNSQSQNRHYPFHQLKKKMLTTVQNQNYFFDDVLEDFTKKPRRIDLLFK